jgi:preprotein translocase subunit SecF
MEFFSRTMTVDWMGKAKFWVAFSVLLLLIGGVSLYRNGGLRYGVDFKGGTQVYVRFAEKPPVDRIRAAMAAKGLGDSRIQEIRDLARPDLNEVLIDLEQKGTGDEALDAGKNTVLQALGQTFGTGEANKRDFNAVTPAALAEFLVRKDPLGAGADAAERYTQLARELLSYRDTQRSGLLTNLDELKSVAGVNDSVLPALRGEFTLGSFSVRKVEIVGPRVGAQLRRQAVMATLYALAGMLVYIAFRFEWVYGAAAVFAVFHDVAVTLGLFSVFGHELTLTEIAALLTLVGYSMNDKIVIFDRVRENLRLMRRDPMSVIVNRSINQTFSRTMLTGGLTFVSLVLLFILGGDVLRGFSFILVVGIMVGTYSSFGIAAPLVVAWNHWRGRDRATGAGAGSGGRGRQEEPARERPVVAGASRASATGGVRR